MTGESLRASIVGAAGYTGGELLRLVTLHPKLSLHQATSRTLAGKPVTRTHPNLRGFMEAVYVDPEELEETDVLFLCMPHGEAAGAIDRYSNRCRVLVDLSADHRISDAELREAWYGGVHPKPEVQSRFVYGLPESRREALRGATHISGVGCNATAMILALLPLARAGFIKRAVVDLKVGSSESGASATAASHHPERSGAVRTFAPAGHRHQAEVIQELGDFELHVTATAIEMVRGVLCTAHIFPTRPVETRELWALYREAYASERFVRIVKERTGLHRFPDPKILAGTNLADVGFEVDERTGRVVCLSAIDNLVKGAAGSAIQSVNIALGFDEAMGLVTPGLHPL